MSINHITDATAVKLNLYSNSITVDDQLSAENINATSITATNEISGNVLVASEYVQSAGDKVELDASAKYLLGDIFPVGFVSTPIDLTLVYEEKKVFNLATGTYDFSLTIKGNFKVLAGLPANTGVCEYSMTITDPILDGYLNANVLFSQGKGVGANGSGAASTYLNVVQTNVANQLKLGFGNITHTQTPQNFNINNDFEIKLLAV